MGEYRKKPVVVQATQWFRNGDHPEDGTERFAGGKFDGELYEGKVVRYFRHPGVSGDRKCEKCGATMHVHGWIDTLEGGHIVCPADWIITGVQGERYPCKPDIFAATYEDAATPRAEGTAFSPDELAADATENPIPDPNTVYKVQCQHCGGMTHINGILVGDLGVLHAAIAYPTAGTDAPRVTKEDVERVRLKISEVICGDRRCGPCESDKRIAALCEWRLKQEGK